MLLLGIETSCDETSVALVEGKGETVRVLGEATASQIKFHKKYGGVVPEVAARRHVEAIIPLLDRVLKHSKLLPTSYFLLPPKIDAIAVTAGPGLLTSLLVGVETAKTLSYLWKVPLVRVQHIVGHIYANWITSDRKFEIRNSKFDTISNIQYRISTIQFPALALVVSGGHTELILMKNHGHFRVIGRTRDDAAGEAFDKVAALLDLPYPGGPAISKCAEKGNPRAIALPRPMIDSEDYDFSFAGLKTAVLYYMKGYREKGSGHTAHSNVPAEHLKPYTLNPKPFDLCASFEQAVVDVLVVKTIRAARAYKVKTILLGGGVSANTRLRIEMARAIRNLLPTCYFLLPPLHYSTDNAAMIASAGYFMIRTKGKRAYTPWQKMFADPEWEL